MRKILQKIYDTIIPVSWKNFNLYMEAVTESLNGMTIATEQQSEMLANLVNQINIMQQPKVKKDKTTDIEEDRAFQ